MIKFEEHASQSKGIDLTPMIDVVFLLLIFFLLTSIFARPSIPLDLPEAETAKMAAESEVSLAIKKDGSILLNGRIAPVTELFADLTELYRSRGAKSINLFSDKGVPFGKVIEVMDIAKKVGVENIAVIAERKK